MISDVCGHKHGCDISDERISTLIKSFPPFFLLYSYGLYEINIVYHDINRRGITVVYIIDIGAGIEDLYSFIQLEISHSRKVQKIADF